MGCKREGVREKCADMSVNHRSSPGWLKEHHGGWMREGSNRDSHSNYNYTELGFHCSALLIQRSPNTLQILTN